MASSLSAQSNSLERIEWMWQSNPNPWLKSEPVKWTHYSDVEKLIIEDAFSKEQPQAILDNYYIDFKDELQISKYDSNAKRPIKRLVCKREGKHLRKQRFMDLSIASERFIDPSISSERPYGSEYGWISRFVVEVRRALDLQPNDLPSKMPEMIPMLVEKAALGIIEEGKSIGKKCEAEKLAGMLRQEKNKTMEDVWKRCAYIYTLESFLYGSLNKAMRLVGSPEHELIWRDKIRTLGPFCLLLWDDPINTKMKAKTILYRAAKMEPWEIDAFKDMAQHPNVYRSFQAFTSCSRNRQKAEEFAEQNDGNTLFIMNILFAFTADLQKSSEYPDEEEELITPGVCFCVERVEFDCKTNNHLIYLKLKQRFSVAGKNEITTAKSQAGHKDAYRHSSPTSVTFLATT